MSRALQISQERQERVRTRTESDGPGPIDWVHKGCEPDGMRPRKPYGRASHERESPALRACLQTDVIRRIPQEGRGRVQGTRSPTKGDLDE